MKKNRLKSILWYLLLGAVLLYMAVSLSSCPADKGMPTITLEEHVRLIDSIQKANLEVLNRQDSLHDLVTQRHIDDIRAQDNKIKALNRIITRKQNIIDDYKGTFVTDLSDEELVQVYKDFYAWWRIQNK